MLLPPQVGNQGLGTGRRARVADSENPLCTNEKGRLSVYTIFPSKTHLYTDRKIKGLSVYSGAQPQIARDRVYTNNRIH